MGVQSVSGMSSDVGLSADRDDIAVIEAAVGAHGELAPGTGVSHPGDGLSSEDLVLASKYGFHANISPDGSRIVYSTCQYESRFTRKPGDPIHAAYEIATINIDGSERHRVTDSPALDHFPVWSPDGSSIAQVFSADDIFLEENGLLFLRFVDESKRLVQLTRPMGVALYPPVWSPDGKYIAFTVYGESSERVIYTIEASGAGLTRLGKTTTLPTWSPDGRVLAFADSVETGGNRKRILLANPGSTQVREVWSNGADDPSGQVSGITWSPDGSELLVVSNHLWTIGADGSDKRHVIPRSYHFLPEAAVWSSDGSQIALYGWDNARSLGSFKVITLDRDGTNLRVVVELDAGRGLNVRQPYALEKEVDVASCSEGSVVPDPEARSSLVADCEVLLRSLDRLSGTASLNWGPTTPISEWQGVEVGGSPSRVRSLRLVNKGLSGSIPPELGRLTELGMLSLSTYAGSSPNQLTGVIPPELGALTLLKVLDVGGNFLSGHVPDELGGLQELRAFNIEGNFLTGCIPEPLLDAVVSDVVLKPCGVAGDAGP